MPISKLPARLVVDANPILSALIFGAARRLFWSPGIQQWLTTAWTINELERHIPRLARKAHIAEELVRLDLQLLPLQVHDRAFYADQIPEAARRIGARDPKDVDLLALALKVGEPVWTNDNDFEVAGVPCYTTALLLKLMDSP